MSTSGACLPACWPAVRPAACTDRARPAFRAPGVACLCAPWPAPPGALRLAPRAWLDVPACPARRSFDMNIHFLNGSWDESIGGPRFPERGNYSTAFLEVRGRLRGRMLPLCWQVSAAACRRASLAGARSQPAPGAPTPPRLAPPPAAAAARGERAAVLGCDGSAAARLPRLQGRDLRLHARVSEPRSVHALACGRAKALHARSPAPARAGLHDHFDHAAKAVLSGLPPAALPLCAGGSWV